MAALAGAKAVEPAKPELVSDRVDTDVASIKTETCVITFGSAAVCGPVQVKLCKSSAQ